jgi:hypothetical protein
MNEHTFARRLSKALRDQGLYVWKINANFAGGVPDMWVSGPQGDMWLELKWGRMPIRNRTTINLGLSQQQYMWLHKRHLQGVRVAVVWACPDGILVLDVPSTWTGLDVGGAKTLLVPFNDALQHIYRYVGTGVPENGHAETHSADSGAARDSHKDEKHLATKARRTGNDPNRPRRAHRNNPRRADAVPQPTHSDPHRLCVGFLPRAAG